MYAPAWVLTTAAGSFSSCDRPAQWRQRVATSPFTTTSQSSPSSCHVLCAVCTNAFTLQLLVVEARWRTRSSDLRSSFPRTGKPKPGIAAALPERGQPLPSSSVCKTAAAVELGPALAGKSHACGTRGSKFDSCQAHQSGASCAVRTHAHSAVVAPVNLVVRVVPLMVSTVGRAFRKKLPKRSGQVRSEPGTKSIPATRIAHCDNAQIVNGATR